jgi:hypothetical protein
MRRSNPAAVKVAERTIVKAASASPKPKTAMRIKTSVKSAKPSQVVKRTKVKPAKARELTARVQQFMVSVGDGAGKVKFTLGPYLSRRSANVDAKSALLKLAKAGKLGSVSTVRSSSLKQKFTVHRPSGQTTRTGYARGRYTRWRVAGDVGYATGAGATYREAVVVVQDGVTIRANSGRKKKRTLGPDLWGRVRANSGKKRKGAKRRRNSGAKFALQMRVGKSWMTIDTYGDEMAAGRMLWHKKQEGGTYRVVKQRVRKNPEMEQCSRCFGRGYQPQKRSGNKPGFYARTCAGCGGSGQRPAKIRKTIAKQHGPKKPTKFTTLYVVQGSYGHGWEDIAASETYKDAKADLKSYRENEPGAHRLISRKVLRSTGEPAKRSR